MHVICFLELSILVMMYCVRHPMISAFFLSGASTASWIAVRKERGHLLSTFGGYVLLELKCNRGEA